LPATILEQVGGRLNFAEAYSKHKKTRLRVESVNQ
jgi:hypothetical protein